MELNEAEMYRLNYLLTNDERFASSFDSFLDTTATRELIYDPDRFVD